MTITESKEQSRHSYVNGPQQTTTHITNGVLKGISTPIVMPTHVTTTRTYLPITKRKDNTNISPTLLRPTSP